MHEQINCGNFRMELTAYTREYLEAGMSLAFAARPAMAYAYTKIFGIVFFQYVEREEFLNNNHPHLIKGEIVDAHYAIQRFPQSTYVGECTIMAWNWLQEIEYETVLVGRRNQIFMEMGGVNGPSYFIKKGFEIRTSDDGILGDHHGVICYIKPAYMVCYQ